MTSEEIQIVGQLLSDYIENERIILGELGGLDPDGCEEEIWQQTGVVDTLRLIGYTREEFEADLEYDDEEIE